MTRPSIFRPTSFRQSILSKDCSFNIILLSQLNTLFHPRFKKIFALVSLFFSNYDFKNSILFRLISSLISPYSNLNKKKKKKEGEEKIERITCTRCNYSFNLCSSKFVCYLPISNVNLMSQV